MNEPIDNLSSPAPRGPAAACWIAIVVVGVAFFFIEHNVLISRMEMYGTTQDELETNAAGGKLANQVGYSLVALLGGSLLVLPGGRRWRLGGVLPVIVFLFIAWCLASSTWSINPMQSAKRGVILLFCVAGALGIARQLSPRQVCWLCMVVTASYAAIGIGAEIALGTFKVFSADYRFAGTLHPNGQGANCALLCLSTICLLGSARRGRAMFLVLLACGIALMLLTRSRTAVAALLAGLAVVSCINLSRQLVAGALALVWFTAAAALVAVLGGVDLVEEVPRLLTLGRSQDITTLTGRTELWEELIPYAEQKPLLGYGYGSFWNADHIDEFSKSLYWDLSSAHSVYLEMVLGVGLFGLALLVSMLAAGVRRAAGQYRLSRAWGDAFVLAILVYGVVDGFSESDFMSASFYTLVASCGLYRLAFFAQESGIRDQESGVRDQESSVSKAVAAHSAAAC
jgi:O-antigen ligase